MKEKLDNLINKEVSIRFTGEWHGFLTSGKLTKTSRGGYLVQSEYGWINFELDSVSNIIKNSIYLRR